MPGPMIRKNGLNLEQDGFDLHGLCMQMLIEGANKKSPKTAMDELSDSARREPKPNVMTASIVGLRHQVRPKQDDPRMLMIQRIVPTTALDDADDIPDSTDLVRSYFPEVWLFDDFQLE